MKLKNLGFYQNVFCFKKSDNILKNSKLYENIIEWTKFTETDKIDK